MNRRPVSSSNVASVGWEPEGEGASGVLEVEFHSGHVYRYLNVEQSVYRQLMGASSTGKFMNRSIIGQYDEERVS